MKLTSPADIPRSEIEAIIVIKLLIAENTPKSEIEIFLAIIIVKRKPKKAEATFPAKRT